jgi:hypothetical protein
VNPDGPATGELGCSAAGAGAGPDVNPDGPATGELGCSAAGAGAGPDVNPDGPATGDPGGATGGGTAGAGPPGGLRLGVVVPNPADRTVGLGAV